MGAGGLGSGRKPHDTISPPPCVGGGCLQQHLNSGRASLSAAAGGGREHSIVGTRLVSGQLQPSQPNADQGTASVCYWVVHSAEFHGEVQILRKHIFNCNAVKQT